MKKNLFLILFSISLFGQEFPLIENLSSINDKLITSFYNIVEDDYGNIWISTNEGIFKYNGYTYKEFNITNGLPSNDIFYISKDAKGRMWFAGYYNGLYYIENDEIKNIAGTENYNSLHFFYEENGNLYFRELGRGIFYVLKKNSLQLQKIDYVCIYKGKKIYYKDRQFFVEDKGVVIPFEKDFVYNSNIWPGEFIFQKLKQPKGPFNHVLDRNIPNYYYTVSEDQKLKEYFVPEWGDVEIEYIPVILNYTLTIFKYKNEIKVFENKIYSEGTTLRIKNILKEFKINLNEITRIYVDSKDEIWMLLKNYKLITIPDDYNQIIKFKIKERFLKVKDFNITNQNANNNNIVIHNDGKMFLCNENLNVFNEYDLKFDSKKICSYKNAVYLFGEQEVLKFSFENLKSKILNVHYYIKSSTCKEDKILCLFRDNVYDVQNDSTFNFNEKIRLNALDFSDSYLFATNEQGIFRYDKATKEVLKNTSVKGAVTLSLVKNEIVLGTNGRGLLVLNEDLKIKKTFLEGENIFFLSYDKETNLVYISSTSGNYTLKLDKEATLQRLNLFKGKIDNIIYLKDYICFLIDGDLIRINKNYLEKEKIDKINVVNIKSNKRSFDHKLNTIVLDPKEFTLEIDLLTNSNYKNILFYKKYEVLDVDQNKVIQTGLIENNKIKLPDVETGNYEILIELCNHYHSSLLTKKIKVQKLAPFYENTGFKIIILFLLILTIFMTNIFSDFILKSRFSKRLDIIDLEQKMLIKQMNPHYLFNALTNLQFIIFLKNESEVKSYLSKFSKLLRSTLDLTNKKSNLLSSEFKYIENYVSFENEKHNLSIELIIQNKTDLNISENSIPTMLLQPIIENAIIHGFLSSSEPYKKIEIIIEDYNKKTLRLSISDNGVGRKTYKYKEDSVALANIAKRLEIFSKILKAKYSLKIIDLKDEMDNPLGTKVKLKIPLF